MSQNDQRLAVLIDAENVPYSNIKGILEEITKYGVPTIKRIYGDWTKSNVSGWKKSLLENAITPIQQYSYTSGKNSSDSAMIIDAMDILYSDKVEGFCIISSDSDFTRLVVRLREAGKKVYGIGERKTPNPFIVACDKFTYIEIIGGHAATNTRKDAAAKTEAETDAKSTQSVLQQIDGDIIALISNSIDDVADEQGWAYLGDVGNLIQKKQPDFDARNYGYSKLSSMIKTMKMFEIDVRDTYKNSVKHIYVRQKNGSVSPSVERNSNKDPREKADRAVQAEKGSIMEKELDSVQKKHLANEEAADFLESGATMQVATDPEEASLPIAEGTTKKPAKRRRRNGQKGKTKP